jgi:hypothetical protein
MTLDNGVGSTERSTTLVVLQTMFQHHNPGSGNSICPVQSPNFGSGFFRPGPMK